VRARLTVAVALLAAFGGGCGGKGVCSYQILARIPASRTVACCGGSYYDDVPIQWDDAEVDLAFAKVAGTNPPVHAWLTTVDCRELFQGEYPPVGGAPAPRCTTYIGPVSPGEVSSRRKLPRGAYRVWVQAFTASPEPFAAIVDVGVWGVRCGATGP
jgi:hypothetical protein